MAAIRPHATTRSGLLALACLGGCPPVCLAAEDPERPPPIVESELAGLSLSELLDVEVTSASRRPQDLMETAAAITVITAEDIRESGALSLPELLRGVPGLHVAQANAHHWAISARGYNQTWANKLLVLLDGRTIYSQLFGGVHWDANDIPLAEIARIEVIRGPGAAVWGANAVNGVINIITRKASETIGGMGSAVAGTQERASGYLRWGGAIGTRTHFRAHAKYTDRAGEEIVEDHFDDRWHSLQGGVRFDVDLAKSELMVKLSAATGRVGEPAWKHPLSSGQPGGGGLEPFDIHSVHARWTRRTARSEWSFQAHHETLRRGDDYFHEMAHGTGLDLQQVRSLGRRHELVWGVEARFQDDETRSAGIFMLLPAAESSTVLSAFVQDEMHFARPRLRLTLGAKLELIDGGALELQPNLRLLWRPRPSQVLWAAISRSVRRPSRVDQGMRVDVSAFPGPDGTTRLVSILGTPGLEPEEVRVEELGWRSELGSRLDLDMVVFRQRYRREIAFLADTPFQEGEHLVLPLRAQNAWSTETLGAELALAWSPTDRLRLEASASWLSSETEDASGAPVARRDSHLASTPSHQESLRLHWKAAPSLAVDGALHSVGSLPDGVPGYTRLDLGLTWRVRPSLDLRWQVRNALDGSHVEFDDVGGTGSTAVRRSGEFLLTWSF